MIKFNGLDLKDVKITDAIGSVINVKKIAVGSEIIWEKSSGGLPSGYTEVKYLHSDGNQWIDTGVKPNSTTDFYLDFLFVENNLGWVQAFGCTRNEVALYALSVHTIYGYIVFGSGATQATIVSLANNKNIRVQVEKRGNDLYFNGNYVASRTSSMGEYQDNIYLFAAYESITDSVASIRTEMKIYSFKIYNNTTLVRDFIPCLDNNNVPCFFDMVSRQTFYNAGTGTFGYETMDGTVVNPT